MECFIGEAVRSAIAQEFTDLEIIVVDNASTDETQDVLRQFDDPRLHVYRNATNLGAIANFNRAVELATSPWIKFLEADDLLMPSCVSEMINASRCQPGVGMVSVGRILIDAKGVPVGWHYKERSETVPGATLKRRIRRMGNEIGTPTEVMARKEVLVAAGLFDPDFGSYLNDWDLWIRCMERCDVGFVAGPLTYVRRHGGQIGVAGRQANLDIDVNFLMWRKRCGNAKLWSAGGIYRLGFCFMIVEGFLWRGVIELLRGRASPWRRFSYDFMLRTMRHAGPAKFLFGVCYTILRSPLFVKHKLGRWHKVRQAKGNPAEFLMGGA